MSETTVMNPALERAIALAGGKSPLARVCGVAGSVVTLACQTGRVPARMAMRMQEYLGIPCTESVPHVFRPIKAEGDADADVD